MYSVAADAEITTYLKVDKVDGRTLYYRVRGELTEEIDEATYNTELES